jgi:hypothetical protein
LGNIPIKRIPNPETKASNKFAIGPAKETRGMSNFGFLKFLESIGTGFAHPKRIGDLNDKSIAGRIMLPNKSM